MKKILLFIILILAIKSNAQNEKVNDSTKSNPVSIKDLDVKPEFPGGFGKFYQFVAENLKVPENGISGKVFLSFVVEADGSITDVKVAKGINPEIDNEVVRVMKLSPNWKPGKMKRESIRVLYSLPIMVKGK